MKISELGNQRIIVSSHSITVKDDKGKTKGVVRNITNLYELQPNKQFEFAEKLRKVGLERPVYMKYLDKIILYENALYFLVDDYVLSIEEKLGNASLFDTINELSKGMEIIHCSRITWSQKRK